MMSTILPHDGGTITPIREIFAFIEDTMVIKVGSSPGPNSKPSSTPTPKLKPKPRSKPRPEPKANPNPNLIKVGYAMAAHRLSELNILLHVSVAGLRARASANPSTDPTLALTPTPDTLTHTPLPYF